MKVNSSKAKHTGMESNINMVLFIMVNGVMDFLMDKEY